METKSIITNLMPVFTLTVAFFGAIIAGLITSGDPVLVVIVYPVLYFIFYLIIKANRMDFPLYFFIAMIFGIANETFVTEKMFSLIIFISLGILSLISFINVFKSAKQKLVIVPSCGIKNAILFKYRKMYESDPNMRSRITVHTIILYIAGMVGLLLREHHGFWVLLTCGAVFIGDELEVLKKRGFNHIYGLIIGGIIASFIGYFQVPLILRTLIILPAIVIASQCMPKVKYNPRIYILGSSMVAVQVIIGASFNQTYLTSDLVIDRFICGIIGIIVAIGFTSIANLVNKEVYLQETPERAA